jgi:hypothetical protein
MIKIIIMELDLLFLLKMLEEKLLEAGDIFLEIRI